MNERWKEFDREWIQTRAERIRSCANIMRPVSQLRHRESVYAFRKTLPFRRIENASHKIILRVVSPNKSRASCDWESIHAVEDSECYFLRQYVPNSDGQTPLSHPTEYPNNHSMECTDKFN